MSLQGGMPWREIPSTQDTLFFPFVAQTDARTKHSQIISLKSEYKKRHRQTDSNSLVAYIDYRSVPSKLTVIPLQDIFKTPFFRIPGTASSIPEWELKCKYAGLLKKHCVYATFPCKGPENLTYFPLLEIYQLN